MATKKKVSFEASARLQRLIGRDLIPNAQMAIVELVKNGYDSGARKVIIAIQPYTPKEPGYITVTDDGEGMSEREIESLFMLAGFSERPDQVKKRKRIPTGEKGIGRFAADKLGHILEVTTAKIPKEGIRLNVDWRDFEAGKEKKFSDVSAEYELVDLTGRLKKSGTILRITRLRDKWSKRELDDLGRWLGDLLNPFAPPNNFTIELQVHGRNARTTTIKPVAPTGDLALELSVEKGAVHRKTKLRESKGYALNETVGSSAKLDEINGLRARFIHFDARPKKDATHGLSAGVRIYRDGFRIEPFGSPTADWLGVAEHRAKRAGHAHIVPSRLFGYVEISRTHHPEISDTTSRQVLLDNDAVRSMVTVLREGLSSLNQVLMEQKAPVWEKSFRERAMVLEQARLYTLGEAASSLAHELRQPLQSIRTAASNIKKLVEQSGVTDDRITNSQAAIDRGIERINKNIVFISGLSRENVTDLAEVDLVELLKNEAETFADRCSENEIELKLTLPKIQVALTNEIAINTVVANFVRNSIESIRDSEGRHIEISLSKSKGFHRIEVQDDGAGVAEEVENRIFSRFTTAKTGGMGYGLYHSKRIVEALGGEIGFENQKVGVLFWAQFPET